MVVFNSLNDKIAQCTMESESNEDLALTCMYSCTHYYEITYPVLVTGY